MDGIYLRSIHISNGKYIEPNAAMEVREKAKLCI